MVTVVVEPVPSPALDAKIAGWAERIGTLAGAFGGIVADFHATETRRFAEEGPGWQQLAPRTVAERARQGYGGEHMILHRTGLLEGSLSSAGPGSVQRVSPDELFVGTDVPYAHWHQTGGSKPGRPPQRVLVSLDEAAKARWMGMLAAWIGGLDVHVTIPGGPGGIT